MTANELVQAISEVVAYARPDEEDDYAIQIAEGNVEPGDEAHIVFSLRKLARFVGML